MASDNLRMPNPKAPQYRPKRNQAPLVQSSGQPAAIEQQANPDEAKVRNRPMTPRFKAASFGRSPRNPFQ